MLNFERTGNGKEVLVLLHGFMENISIWSDMEPHLSKNFSLLKIDLPGHGQSDIIAEVQTMELMAEEVKKVLDDQKLEKVHLLGHSMGGYISLGFAEKYPEYLPAFEAVLQGNRLYANNMFILKREQYQKFMPWWFGMMFEFERRIDLENYTGYQKRILGFIAERLLTVWFKKEQLNCKELQLIYFKKFKNE